MTANGNSHETRISRLEAAVATLAEGQEHTMKSLDSLTDKVERGFGKLADRNAQKPYGMMATWAGVMLAFVGLASAPFAWGVVRIYDAQQAHFASEGHPALVQRVEAIEDQKQELLEVRRVEAARLDERFEGMRGHSDRNRAQVDDTLQREMRLLDDALQREMRTLLDAPLEKLRGLEDRIKKLETG